MTRAYIRTDPGVFMRKAVEQRYPVGAYAAYDAVRCLGEEQPERGRFRSARLLRLLLDDPTEGVHLGWGKWVPYLIDHGDLTRLPDGSLYIDGWDEWQEGDVTVRERMSRLRDRKRNAGQRNGLDTSDTSPTVTIPSEPLAVGGKPEAVSGKPSINGRTSSTSSVDPRDLTVAADARKV